MTFDSTTYRSFPITGYTSSSVVTITVPSSYINLSKVAYSPIQMVAANFQDTSINGLEIEATTTGIVPLYLSGKTAIGSLWCTYKWCDISLDDRNRPFCNKLENRQCNLLHEWRVYHSHEWEYQAWWILLWWQRFRRKPNRTRQLADKLPVIQVHLQAVGRQVYQEPVCMMPIIFIYAP